MDLISRRTVLSAVAWLPLGWGLAGCAGDDRVDATLPSGRQLVMPKELRSVDGVLDKFNALAGEQSMLVTDTDEYVKSVLRKALGEDKANLLIDRILQGADVTGIESLKWMDAGSVGELLRNEHPQIVAAILVHLDFDQAGSVLKTFPERQRNEVMVRIATLDGIQPSALKDLNEVMSKVLAGGDRLKKASLGGQPQLVLTPTVDILAELGQRRGSRRQPLLVGFAAETHDVLDHARAKLGRKGADWIVANDVSGAVMGGSHNAVYIVSAAGVESLPEAPKEEVARWLVERIADALS